MKENENLGFDPTTEFLEHCGCINNKIYTYVDGYDYIDVSENGDEIIITVNDSPIHGEGTYCSTDSKAKDISLEEALHNITLKYNNKHITIINLRK